MPILATDDLHKFYRQTNDMDKAWEMMAAMRCPVFLTHTDKSWDFSKACGWVLKCLAS